MQKRCHSFELRTSAIRGVLMPQVCRPFSFQELCDHAWNQGPKHILYGVDAARGDGQGRCNGHKSITGTVVQGEKFVPEVAVAKGNTLAWHPGFSAKLTNFSPCTTVVWTKHWVVSRASDVFRTPKFGGRKGGNTGRRWSAAPPQEARSQKVHPTARDRHKRFESPSSSLCFWNFGSPSTSHWQN